MSDDLSEEAPRPLRWIVELTERYDYQIDVMSALLLVSVAVPVLELINLPEKWQQRTWVGRVGLLVYIPLALITGAFGLCAAVLIVAIHTPIFLMKAAAYEYRERAYKEGHEPDEVPPYEF